MIKTPRALGVYVLAMVLLQAGLYGLMTGRPDKLWLCYLDPRIGFMLIRESTVPAAMQWASVAVSTVLAAGLISRRVPPAVYLGIEFVLAVPSVIFFAIILFANMSPSHGFSIGELLIPAPVFALFSGVPMYSAYRMHRPA